MEMTHRLLTNENIQDKDEDDDEEDDDGRKKNKINKWMDEDDDESEEERVIMKRDDDVARRKEGREWDVGKEYPKYGRYMYRSCLSHHVFVPLLFFIIIN